MAAAGIKKLSESATSLTMRYTSAAAAGATIMYSRAGVGEYWQAPVQPGGPDPGITFGNTAPRYATTARLRALGISVDQAVRTFDPSITSRPLDDVSIFQTFESSEVAAALWQQGSITEIWHVGTLVSKLLAPDPDKQICERMKKTCCRKKAPAPPPLPPPGQDPVQPCPTQIPNPKINACVMALDPNNVCPANIPETACSCLRTACLFCGSNEACCENNPGLDDLSADACVAWYGRGACNEPPQQPEPMIEVNGLLGEVANRLQAIIDLEGEI